MVEDHLRTMLSKTQGPRFWRTYDNKNIARSSHTVFGDFPKDLMHRTAAFSPSPYKSNKKMAGLVESPYDSPIKDTRPLSAIKRSRKKFSKILTLYPIAYIRKGQGSGGKTASLLKTPPKDLTQRPFCGAMSPRFVP